MKVESGWIIASTAAELKRRETGWDEGGNCMKCGEAGNCHCDNHFIPGVRRYDKPVRIRRVPLTSPMFKRYSKDKGEIYRATGERLSAVGSLEFIVTTIAG